MTALAGIKKIIDSNIIIYSLLKGHPASDRCEELIREGFLKIVWVTSPVTFFEIFSVMKKGYGIDGKEVLSRLKTLLETPLYIPPLTKEYMESTLTESEETGIDINDAVLVEIAKREGISTIITDDEKLKEICKEIGITVESPIDDIIRNEISEWEKENLPEKGI